MLFYEPLFLTAFPALYAMYLVMRDARARRWLMLIASLLFYAWGEPLFVPVLVVSALIDYGLTARLHATHHDGTRKILLAIGIVLNLGLLVFYKYTDFLIANFNAVLAPLSGTQIPLLKIALPIGVSFVVFEKITYLVDTYRRITPPAERFSDYALFVLFFPKLLAGPILKYHEMKAQIAAPPTPELSDAWQGFLRLAIGLGKKLLIADTMGACADQIFSAAPEQLSLAQSWLGLLAFTLQIYFDFSGYSDMAIGISRMFGIRLRENFNMPYIARSMSDFWRRWHISLTTWIRDYLYIPLGGNQHGAIRTMVNLWLCFLLSGLWHGASWNFILWGAYNGLFLTLDRVFLARALERLPSALALAITFFLVMIGWAIFRSPNSAHLAHYLAALAGLNTNPQMLDIGGDVPAIMTIGLILVLAPALPFFARLRDAAFATPPRVVAMHALIVTIYVLALARALAVPFKPFIYFRF